MHRGMPEELISCESSLVMVVIESAVGHNISESLDKESRFVRRRHKPRSMGTPAAEKSFDELALNTYGL